MLSNWTADGAWQKIYLTFDELIGAIDLNTVGTPISPVRNRDEDSDYRHYTSFYMDYVDWNTILYEWFKTTTFMQDLPNYGFFLGELAWGYTKPIQIKKYVTTVADMKSYDSITAEWSFKGISVPYTQIISSTSYYFSYCFDSHVIYQNGKIYFPDFPTMKVNIWDFVDGSSYVEISITTYDIIGSLQCHHGNIVYNGLHTTADGSPYVDYADRLNYYSYDLIQDINSEKIKSMTVNVYYRSEWTESNQFMLDDKQTCWVITG